MNCLNHLNVSNDLWTLEAQNRRFTEPKGKTDLGHEI